MAKYANAGGVSRIMEHGCEGLFAFLCQVNFENAHFQLICKL